MEHVEFSLGNLSDPRLTDCVAATEYLESIRWPDGPICPHCGVIDEKHYWLAKQRRWKCRGCRKQFTVTVGTIFESSHIPLHKWLLAFYLLCASKKGMSAHQLHRMLGVTYKSTWFMLHRIREAMRDPAFTSMLGGTVEADETYVGGKRKSGRRGRPGPADKNKAAVLSLVERGGQARSMHVARVTADELKGAIREHVEKDARIITDEFYSYRWVGREYASHEVVEHGVGEYARGAVHTNTVEGYFSILKRGINGVYHHVSPAHLHRYLNEFDFRYNARKMTDGARTALALEGVGGKRLKYADSR